MGAKVSIGSWAYLFGEYEDNPIEMEEAARRLNELKFDAMSMGGFKPHAHYDLYPTREDRKKLIDLFKSYNLVLNCYGADLWSFPFATGGPEVRKPMMRHLRRVSR